MDFVRSHLFWMTSHEIHTLVDVRISASEKDLPVCLKIAGTSMPIDFQSFDFCICASNCYSNIFVDNIGELSHFGLI